MESEMIQISRTEYEELKNLAKVDQELLLDIARGIKDILEGNVVEV
ncbi:MAG TPA: hypothetical protein VJK51_04625 [Candidatus Nanoarchaeia archaeon]|nr:hypothetical protein [Candidatus Nanoarchaeia archaeon]